MEIALPPSIDAVELALLLGASFATSLITAALGIGGGAILLAVLASLLPPSVLIPVHGVVQLGSNAGRAAIMLGDVDRSVIGPFLLGSAVGAALGGLVAVELPPAAIEIGVGLFVLWSVASRPPAIFRRAAALTGAASTFLSMFFGATGPFVAAYVKTLGLGRLGHVATHAAFMTIQHLVKTLAFGLFGFAFGEWLPLVLLLVASGFAGTVVGRHVLHRLPERRFMLALNAILVLLALRLIWSGASRWL